MKRKILSIFLCSLMLAGGVCGCGKDAPPTASSNDVANVTESTVTAETTDVTEVTITEAQTETQSEFDFIKTVESTYICGQKLSYPITWGQFGKEFTIDSNEPYIVEEDKKIVATVKYKGYEIGDFIFNECISVNEINENTPISSFTIKNFENSNDIEFVVNNLRFGGNHSQLFESLGNDYKEGVGYNQIIYRNDLGLYRFTFDDNDSLVTVGLNVLNNKNMEE